MYMSISCLCWFIIITEPEMWKINQIVIPLIGTSWEVIAYSLEYRAEQVKMIKSNCKGDSEECCRGLFVDWLNTSNGIGPKTWKTLLNTLKERVLEHAAAVEKIECLLLKDKVTPEDLL